MDRDPPIPSGLGAHLDAMGQLARSLEGWLSVREARFLALVAAVPTCDGEILEIGSFKGKSTIILAKSAAFAQRGKVIAVDPLTLPSCTDPTDADPRQLEFLFRHNLDEHAVSALVEFHKMTSGELAGSWDRPLRVLWIDGDHRYEAALFDLEAFRRHLAPGAIVAFHDVLGRFPGVARVFCERVLADDQFGACGVWGSCGWGQFVGGSAGSSHRPRRRRLRARLEALMPHMDQPAHPWREMITSAFRRWSVPHHGLGPAEWLRQVRAVDTAGVEPRSAPTGHGRLE